MALFLWMGLNCLQGYRHFKEAVYFLPFSSQKFLVYTHFINLRRMKGWVNLGATQSFWTRDPWIGNPAPWPLGHWLGNRCQVRFASFSLMISCITETFPRKNKLWLSSTNLTKTNLSLLCLKYSRWFFLVTIPPFYFQISWITGALS